MLKEFKQFILKGNVVDLSTGVIIGASFGAIVTAFTKGIVEPVLGVFGSGATPDFKIEIAKKTVEVMKKNAAGVEEPVKELVPVLLDIGGIIGAVMGFLITAAVVFFIIVKPANKLMALMKKEEAAAPPPAPPADIVLLSEIRDLLKK
ncbi:MAG: large conductance mechanosensitive channel protein MscL [Verrucomicrobiaceae bacterium]|nr:large conductance mechanosensitive channel protein MscL [Verrucomicrobiaceae bacterium]